MHNKRFAFFLSLIYIAWSTAGFASPVVRAPYIWQQPDYVEKAFIEIAFKQEYSNGLYPLAKWVQKRIYYKIQTDHLTLIPELLKPIQSHLKDLQHLTGIHFVKTRSSRKSQFNIILTQDRYFKKHISRFVKNKKFAEKLSRKSNCFASFTTTSNHRIIEANIVIPADHTFERGLYTACVIEETTQVMGLPNDSDWVSPSIANDLDKQELLSPLDRMFLKILYDPGLKPGMTVKEARPRIRRIIHRLLKQSGA